MTHAEATAPGDRRRLGSASSRLSSARSGDQLCGLRPELSFEDVPAPRTLAPYASALAVTVQVAGAEVASGRLVLLYDPAGQDGWAGPLRVIVYIHADLDPEIAQDPLIGQVGWTWLTEALDSRTAGYAGPSGTVTTEVTEGFGAKETNPRSPGSSCGRPGPRRAMARAQARGRWTGTWWPGVTRCARRPGCRRCAG